MMMDTLKKCRTALVRLLEFLLIIAVTALVLVVIYGVFTRYAMGKQADWSEEIARFLLVWISLLGGAVAFGEKAHLGVDYFVGKLEPSAKKFVALFGQIVILIFAVIIFIIGGSNIAVNNMSQQAPALGKYGLMMGHVYLALPIAGVFIIIFTVEQFLETLMSKETDGEGK